jgi:hypothetical protein
MPPYPCPMRARALPALAVLVVLAGGCDRPPAETAPPPEPAAAPGTTPTPTRTSSPSPSPSPTPTPSTEALVGMARVEDPAGDVTDDAGLPPSDPEPAADIRAVELHGDGAALQVTFELDGPVPASADSIVWSLELAVDDDAVYEVTAQLVGGRIVAAVFDWSSGEQSPLDPPDVEGPRLSMTVPAALLERIAGPFEWRALTQLDGGYEDRVPDDQADRAPFPQ